MSESQQTDITAPMVFDSLEPREVPVNLGGAAYVLCEASEGDAAVWTNARVKGAKMADGKVVGVEGVGEIQSLLVHLCLFKAGSDGKCPKNHKGERDISARVPMMVLRGWPTKVVAALYDRARKISELDDRSNETEESLTAQIVELQERLASIRHGKTEVPAKNGQENSMATSDSQVS